MNHFLDETGLGIVWNKMKAHVAALINDSAASSSKVYSSLKTEQKLATKLNIEDSPTKISDLENDSDFIHSTEKGAVNGIATLDGTGKIPTSQLPADTTREYQGLWNASTNTPTIANGTGIKGDYYFVSVAGTWNGVNFNVNDSVIYNGSVWERHVGDAVLSVNGKIGNVNLTAADIPTSDTGLDSNNVNAALTELNTKADGAVHIHEVTLDDYLAHKEEYDASGDMYVIDDSSGKSDASSVGFTPSTIVPAADVQKAIELVAKNNANSISEISGVVDELLNNSLVNEYGEVYTKKIWVNGKHVYKAILYSDNLQVTSDEIVATAIPNYINIDKIITDEIFFNAEITNSGVQEIITANDKFLLYMNYGFIDYIVRNGQLYLYRKHSIPLTKIYTVIEYTKSANIFEDLVISKYPDNIIFSDDPLDFTGMVLNVFTSDSALDLTIAGNGILSDPNASITKNTDIHGNNSVIIAYTYLGATKTVTISL